MSIIFECDGCEKQARARFWTSEGGWQMPDGWLAREKHYQVVCSEDCIKRLEARQYVLADTRSPCKPVLKIVAEEPGG